MKFRNLFLLVFFVFMTSVAFANVVELRGSNKTDNYVLRVTEGWVFKTNYYTNPQSTFKSRMLWDAANNIHVAYRALNQEEFIDLPSCGGGSSYYSTVTVILENPREGSEVPLCSII